MVLLTIIVAAVSGAICFLVGVRYALTKMLPSVLARMTPEELGELGKKAARERAEDT